jgi:8-oxo-dGTP diphosphatase
MKSSNPVYRKYRYAVIATDVIIFTVREGALQVLLIQMKKFPFTGAWAAPGGLVKGFESVDDAAERMLKEKTSVRTAYLEQLATFGKVDRDPFGRVVSVAYFSLIPSLGISLSTTQEYQNVAWFPVHQLPTLAYDHEEMIGSAIERLKSKLEYTNIAYGLLPKEFTLTELQEVYQTILGRPLDKRNFRRKFLSLGLIRDIGRQRRGEANRPAELYVFASRTLQNVQIL